MKRIEKVNGTGKLLPSLSLSISLCLYQPFPWCTCLHTMPLPRRQLSLVGGPHSPLPTYFPPQLHLATKGEWGEGRAGRDGGTAEHITEIPAGGWHTRALHGVPLLLATAPVARARRSGRMRVGVGRMLIRQWRAVKQLFVAQPRF